MLVPKRGSAGCKKGGCQKLQWVEGFETVISDDLVLSGKILHRATKRVKFHRVVIAVSELTIRNKVLNKIRRNQNITKTKLVGER